MDKKQGDKTQYNNLREDILWMLKKGESYPFKITKELYAEDKYKHRASFESLYASVRNTVRKMEIKDTDILDVHLEEVQTSGKPRRICKLKKVEL